MQCPQTGHSGGVENARRVASILGAAERDGMPSGKALFLKIDNGSAGEDAFEHKVHSLVFT
jgi:hypothetical protein